MACYGCGGTGGTECQLCEQCNDARLENAVPFVDKVLSQYKLTWRVFFELVLGDVKRATIFFGMAATATLAFLCFSDYGPGWFTSAAFFERACVSRSADSMTGDLAARANFQRGSTFERVLAERIGEDSAKMMITALGEGQTVLCRDLRVLCRDATQKNLCPQLRQSIS